MNSLYDKLKSYSGEGYYPFHMPGHKRQSEGRPMGDIYSLDITEIPGFDDLHDPKGPIADIEAGFSELYGSKRTYLLVNGSTAGILAAVSAVCGDGDTVLVARNCHQSVYNALSITGARARYLIPPQIGEFYGSIPPEAVEAAFLECDGSASHPIKAVVITSPTYEGVVSDIRAIAGLCHGRGIPLIVDSAHGAHFVLGEGFPEDALRAGADIVIHSLHKTLPSLTQTGLIHISKASGLVDEERLSRYLSVYQTSSPSYILMASIGECLRIIEGEGRKLAREFFEKRRYLIGELKAADRQPMKLQADGPSTGGLHRPCIQGFYRERAKAEPLIYDLDPSKVLLFSDMGGPKLFEVLNERYKLVPEMAALGYVTLILTVFDSLDGYERLAEALTELGEAGAKDTVPGGEQALAGVLAESAKVSLAEIKAPFSFLIDKSPEMVYTIKNALEMKGERLPLCESAGRVGRGFVKVYPPGIPMICPGERITEELTRLIELCIDSGLNVQGLSKDYEIPVIC